MPRYRVTAGKLTVQARSKVHDTTTVWSEIDGDVTADPETLATAGATGRFTINMMKFDAGDFLKNRKLRKDFELERFPLATFDLTAVERVARQDGSFTATAQGELHWRRHRVGLVLQGRGTLDAMTVRAQATFELDIKTLGMQAPRFLMFKVEDEVSVTVEIQGEVVA